MVENNMMAIVVVVSAPTCLILNFVLRVATQKKNENFANVGEKILQTTTIGQTP